MDLTSRGAAVRTKVTGCVYTSNDSPPSQPIPFHHEGGRVPRYPNYLFFFCETPPAEGGETPLCYSPLIYEKMKEKYPQFVERLEQHGVRYSRVLPNGDDQTSAIGRGWQSTFHTLDRKEAEERCKEFETEFEWLDNGCLRTTTKILPAVKVDERTGGAAVRTKVTGCVYTSNDSPPSQPIPFHHEGGRVPRYPNYLFFFCETPPAEGGETPLCYSPLIYEKMKEKCPQFVERLEQHGVRYSRVLPNGDDQTSAIGRGWQSTFHTLDRKEAEERCKEFETEFEWLDSGCLRTTTKILPAVKVDERTGKKIWWNTIIGAYYGSLDERNRERSKMVTYGDGKEIELEYLETCKRILEENKVTFKWEKGDVLLIDNKQVKNMGRNP
ncbi:unnamed protein product [Rotaria sp. Silwood1]|nr:unnamed protein product [Rotaria sp. Silwood1]